MTGTKPARASTTMGGTPCGAHVQPSKVKGDSRRAEKRKMKMKAMQVNLSSPQQQTNDKPVHEGAPSKRRRADDDSKGGVQSSEGEHWVCLADRLNPKRKGYDATFKVKWAALSKAARKKLVKEDKRVVAAIKARSADMVHPFPTEPSDHCETSSLAYEDLAPALRLLAKRLGKAPADLEIYDPFFCAGAVVCAATRCGRDKPAVLWRPCEKAASFCGH